MFTSKRVVCLFLHVFFDYVFTETPRLIILTIDRETWN